MREYDWQPEPMEPAWSEAELVVIAALRQYREGWLFRRRVELALRPTGVTFAEWRVLEALCRCVRRLDSPVDDRTLADELCIDAAAVSRMMARLLERNFIDRQLDCLGLAYRELPTDSATELVKGSYEVVARSLAGAATVPPHRGR